MTYDILRDSGISDLKSYMDSLPEKQATTLAYWIHDYTRFLKQEASFDPKKLIRYKRGSVIKVHLGYKIGSEEGGLHYAVVINKTPALSDKVLTVIPLISIKPNTDLGELHYSKINLGNELHSMLNQKLTDHITKKRELQAKVLETMRSIGDSVQKGELQLIAAGVNQQLQTLQSHIAQAQKMQKEINRMRSGSIALVGQITTVSKIRIYDPLYPADVLSNIRLSDKSMDQLDAKLIELFTKNI